MENLSYVIVGLWLVAAWSFTMWLVGRSVARELGRIEEENRKWRELLSKMNINTKDEGTK